MKILPVVNHTSNQFIGFQNKSKEVKKYSNLNIGLSKIPSYEYMISFQGGKSLSLAQTVFQLDKYSKYPLGVRELAQVEILKGNPSNKTLIDIHKGKYSVLKDMETLEEAKQAFPEFKDVLSDREIEYMPNSFIDDVKEGKNEYFDPEIDLSLQLLQLYWGEGFSLSDLTKQFNGRNIQGTMERLNIPRVDRSYGIYLKLSDKDYNERFTQEMSERQKTVARNIMERREGAYIPRGELTEQHKKNISQGLLKYYSENPDRISEMSKRQKEFYENNPVERIKFTQVLLRAWGYREADSIRKKLSKFMGVKEMTPQELSDVSNPVQSKLKDFWKRNSWAKEQFSKCMKKSWQHQKELTEMGMVYDPIFEGKLFPNALAKEISTFAPGRFPDIQKYITCVVLDPRDGQFADSDFVIDYLERNDEAVQITRDYFNQGDNNNIYSETISLTIDIVLNDLLRNYNKLTPRQKTVFDSLHTTWKNQIAQKAYRHETITSNEIIDIHVAMIDTAVNSGTKEIADKFNVAIEEAYRLVQNNNTKEMAKRTKTLYDDFRQSVVLK